MLWVHDNKGSLIPTQISAYVHQIAEVSATVS